MAAKKKKRGSVAPKTKAKPKLKPKPKPKHKPKPKPKLKRKAGAKPRRLAVPAGAKSFAGGPSDPVDVTFVSAPTGGMTMWVDDVMLTSNPQTLRLTRGDHLLRWRFVGPRGAAFSISVIGARDPTAPITGAIADDQDQAFGSYNVLV